MKPSSFAGFSRRGGRAVKPEWPNTAERSRVIIIETLTGHKERDAKFWWWRDKSIETVGPLLCTVVESS